VIAVFYSFPSAANQELLVGLTTPELWGCRNASFFFVGGQPGTTGWPDHSGTAGWSRYFVLLCQRPIRTDWLVFTAPELRGGCSALSSFVGGQSGKTDWPDHSGTSGWARYFVLFRRRPTRNYWLASPLRNFGVVAALHSSSSAANQELLVGLARSGTSGWSRHFLLHWRLTRRDWST
jgi:hypothetical protein